MKSIFHRVAVPAIVDGLVDAAVLEAVVEIGGVDHFPIFLVGPVLVLIINDLIEGIGVVVVLITLN